MSAYRARRAARLAREAVRLQEIAAALADARRPTNDAQGHTGTLRVIPAHVDELVTDCAWDAISDPVAKEVRFTTQLPAPITRETA